MKLHLSCLALLANVCIAPVTAQTPSCTYDRCALRLQHGGGGVRIVQGRAATRIARVGMFAPRVALLAEADDTTRLRYDAFREYHNRGATFGLVSLALMIGGAAAYYSTDRDSRRWPGVALWVVGAGFSIGASVNTRKGQDALSQSIWFYNRSLGTP
jgi:hypothetical protein